jgi:hypothetical protein
LLEQLEQPGSKRARIRRLDPVLIADVESHDRLDGPLPDPVLHPVTMAATSRPAAS